MKLAAVVPVKALGIAKTRLAAVLNDGERAALALWLAERVVSAVTASAVAERVAVVSPDDVALAWARERGLAALRQEAGGLNPALEVGRCWAQREGAAALLVVLGDLPLLRPDEMRAMAELATRSDLAAHERAAAGVAVLAPDRAGSGTNALLLAPPACLPFSFGAQSRRRHEALARARGVLVATYRAPGTAFDVDRPADLAELRATGLWPLDGRPSDLSAGGQAGRRHDGVGA